MDKKSPTILAIGAATQDVFLKAGDVFKAWRHKGVDYERLPLGAKLEVEEVIYSTGGGACNAAVTFARQDLHSLFMGTIAHDVAGQAVLAQLDEENINTSHVSFDAKHSTGYSTLLLSPSGERTVLVYRGASAHYSQENFDLSGIDADWLYISSMGGAMDVLESIVRQASEKGIKVMCNPGSGELKQIDKLKPLLEDIDVLSVNKEEMQLLVHGDSIEELVLHGMHYCPVVIVSDGPKGVCASDGEVIVAAGMYEDVPVIDRTGAGDAFGSGFLSQWAQGKSLEESILFASANSTSVVGQIGAKAGILHRDVALHDMPIETKPLHSVTMN
jgi:ribokinase